MIGGGLAGCEAAWQLGAQGVPVQLYEMRPNKSTGAHSTSHLAELVCSNSFKSNLPHTASGELKREMRHLGSMVLDAADKAVVPAGEALAVDRDLFSVAVEERLRETGKVEIIRQEITAIPEQGPAIVATGPLTSDALAADISQITSSDRLFFYDAVAPIIEADSINYEHCFEASRYGKGDSAYLNCPIPEELYNQIWQEIVHAETTALHDFENPKFFEGCLPIEEVAKRGIQTLAHGPWKPVGLIDPRTGRQPHAVLQLRQENTAGTCYSMVACQSRMTWPEQRRIFSMIPALEHAVFLRLGVVHRNTYIESPNLLDAALRLKSRPNVFFAGQIVGVEGYLESAATGLLAGVNAARLWHGRDDLFIPPPSCMLGALIEHVSMSQPIGQFIPMNANFGLLPPYDGPRLKRKQDRRAAICEQAFQSLVEATMLSLQRSIIDDIP